MRKLWCEEEPEYHGEHVDFPKVLSRYPPIQRPIPVLCGVHGPGDHVCFGTARYRYVSVATCLHELSDGIVSPIAIMSLIYSLRGSLLDS